MNFQPVAYGYDGSFSGFLTCLYESFAHKEEPMEFHLLHLETGSFYPMRVITTSKSCAKRVYKALPSRLGPMGCTWLTYGFLTCLPDKERWLWQFFQLGITLGPGFTKNLTHPVVSTIYKAVRHLQGEAHQLKGFLRFSELEGVLVSQITPKNLVLPLLRPHFCSRYPQESFLIYDKTHQDGLFYTPTQWRIVPVQDLQLPAASPEEEQYRTLWRSFYHTIAISQRENPTCRRTHMPKRYWGDMTEFQSPASFPALPKETP